MPGLHALLLAGALAACAALAAPPAHAAAGAKACTFAGLSEQDQRRYQSRYRRRVRTDGPVAAERWIHEQACMTADQRRARRKPLLGKDGKPCTKTRLEMRVSPGFDGPMTMSPITVCAH